MGTEIQVKSPKFMAAILMLGAFIGLFGETALNMALTNVMEQFSIEASTAQWLTTGYLLTLAILVPISALLMKWFSTRQVSCLVDWLFRWQEQYLQHLLQVLQS